MFGLVEGLPWKSALEWGLANLFCKGPDRTILIGLQAIYRFC